MKKLIPSIAIAALAAAFTTPLHAEEGEWIELFDGKTLEGWKPSTLGTAEYSVVDGAIKGITVEGSPNTFLLSEKEYGDFELEFEVKVHDSLNSGCQIRSREKSEADLATTGKDGHPAIEVSLKYYEGEPVIREMKRVSKPGRRVYLSVKDIPQVRQGLGVSIVSTSKGVMSDAAARSANVGGEVLCTVF